MNRNILGLIIGITIFFGSVKLLPLAAYQIGKIEAWIDLLQGERITRRCIEFCCNYPGPTRAFDVVSEREFGLKVVMIRGCEEEVVDWQARGYNIQQYDDLERTYGKAKLDEVARRSYQQYLLTLESEPERK